MSKAKETIIPPGLWAGMKIPIIIVSGEVNSGKTIFALTIDPNCRKPHGEVEPTTLVYDQEGSAETYVSGLNFDWRDTRAAVAEGVHRQVVAPAATDPNWLKILKGTADVNDSPAASMFRAWYLSLLKIPHGKYVVGVCDTFTPLQDGMVEWLKKHPEAFGRTSDQYNKASSMFLWPDVKSMLSHILTVDCRLRFESFVINVHLKNKWVGNVKTKERIAEGLDVLDKLATLHLELDRSPVGTGADAKTPKLPAAIVKKERLVRFAETAADDQPILPPRMKICTPDSIRDYIVSPPDFAKLKDHEKVIEVPTTEEDVLRLRMATAEAEGATEETRLQRLQRQAELLKMQQETPAAIFAGQTQGTPKGLDDAAAACKKLETDAIEAERKLASQQAEGKRLMEGHTSTFSPATLKATPHQVKECRDIVVALGYTAEEWGKKWDAARAKLPGVVKVSDLSPKLCHKMIEALRKKLAEKDAADPVPFDVPPAE